MQLPSEKNIGRSRRYLTDASCQTAVQSLVISRIDYCCSLLSNIPETQIHRLQVVQNRAARLVTRTSPRDHITPVLATLHWLPIHLRIAVHTYKCIHHSAPPYLMDLLTPYRPRRILRSSDDPLTLSRINTRRTVGRGDFRHAAPAIWNTIPRHVRDIPTLALFKRHLKAHFYGNHFES